LVATYDVVAEDAPTAGWSGRRRIERAVVVRPRSGSAVEFAATDFPGIFMRVAGGDVVGFPACGCDACDDRLDDVVEQLQEAVARAVAQLAWARRKAPWQP
jgi:hypothetical protein